MPAPRAKYARIHHNKLANRQIVDLHVEFYVPAQRQNRPIYTYASFTQRQSGEGKVRDVNAPLASFTFPNIRKYTE